MTRLGYLLPFLWALGYGADPLNPTIPADTTPKLDTTAEIQTVATVKPTGSQASPAVVTPAATDPSTTKSPTNEVPSLTTETNKPTTTESRSSQTDQQPTTVKAETTSVAAASSKPSLGPTKDNPSVTKSSDSSIKPTNLPKASTPDLRSSTVVVTSNFTENANSLPTQLAATSPTIQLAATSPKTELAAISTTSSRTSESSTGNSLTNNSTTGASGSMVSPPSVATSKTTAEDSTAKQEILPMTTSLVIPIQKNFENIEINCTKELEGSSVKINIEPSSICDASKNEDDVKEILKHICTAIKPGYKPDQEKCHIDFGRGPTELIIVNAYVQSSLSPNDLYASLKHIKKNGSFLFNYGAKYEEEDLVSIPLISAIVSLAVALLIAAAIYGCWHQRQTRKREQRLTEELQTMENGYHDNPTLEVMETSPEMQEKKGGPNGELGDSWIVPLDNLTREDFDEEEDTHL